MSAQLNDFRTLETTIRLKGIDARVIMFGVGESLYAKGYSGKRKNHDFYSRFSNMEALNRYIDIYRDKLLTIQARKAEFKSEQKARKELAKASNIGKVKVGDIFTTHWGYDQTNVEFFQVVELLSNVTIKLQEIDSIIVDDTRGDNKKMPKIGSFHGDIMTKRLSFYGDSVSVKFESFRHGSLWNGKPQYFSRDC